MLPSGASAVVVGAPNGQFFGLALRHGVSPGSISGSRAGAINTSADGSVDYHNGPVLHSSAPYLIFWDPSSHIPASSQTLLRRYMTDAAADSGRSSNVYSVLRQYTDSTGFSDYKQTFSDSHAVVATDPFPTHKSGCRLQTGVTNCITDTDFHNELNSLISAHSLPTGTGPSAPVYLIITPQDTNVCMSSSACASNDFCAYHSDYTDAGHEVLYATIPFVVWTVDSTTKGCQTDGTAAYQTPNSDHADQIADNLSHELSETITDPVGGTGWWNGASGEEVGDNCASYGSGGPNIGQSLDAYAPTLGGSEGAGTLFDQLINGGRYYTQTEWSNGDIGCQTRTSPDALAPSFTDSAPGHPGTPVAFAPTGSTTSPDKSISSVTWNFGDGSPPAFATGAPPVNHSFSHIGVFNVTLSVVDSVGNVATVAHQVAIGAKPTASFGSAPAHLVLGGTASFDASGSSDPNPGGSITAYTWNFGDGSGLGSGIAPHHSYAAPGLYAVTLLVRDSFGLTQSVSHPIAVLAPQIIKLSAHRRKIEVTVDGPGTVIVGKSRHRVSGAQTVTVTIKLTKAQVRRLKHEHKLRLSLTVTFKPSAGPIQHRVVHTTVRR